MPGLAARAGVVTGEVAVTLGAAQEGMVAGDAVNTAARVQAAADPGSGAGGWGDAAAGRAWGRVRRRGGACAEGQGRAAAPVAGGPGAGRGGRVAAGGRSGGAADRTGRGAAHDPGAVSCGGRSGGCRGWCWCPGRPGWASRGWAGSSASTSTGWRRTVWWHRGRCLSVWGRGGVLGAGRDGPAAAVHRGGGPSRCRCGQAGLWSGPVRARSR